MTPLKMNDVVLVGCGKMGGAMLSGWISSGAAERVHVVEPIAPPAPGATSWVTAASELPAGLAPDCIVLAVKPQAMDDTVGAYRAFAADETVFLSIAAGKTIAYFQDRLGPKARIVRAMPNTPAAIGRGISVLVADASVDQHQRDQATALMQAAGAVEWVDDEALIDPVTALSGGGPAYVFLLMETLCAAGIDAGLPEDLAARLAEQTVIGAAALADAAADTPATLRRNVTSPRGTTEAALAVLMDDETGIPPVFRKAIAAAAARSRDLAG